MSADRYRDTFNSRGEPEYIHSDVLVVGAGPGGATAAYWLARLGADVLFVDKAHFPRQKPCGDGLAPGADEMLGAMGLGDFLHSHGRLFRGLHLLLPGGERTRLDSVSRGENQDGHGWVIPRSLLDDELRRNAEAAGARFLPGFTARLPLYKRGRLSGITGLVGGKPLTIDSPLVVLATGASRGLLCRLGLAGDMLPASLGLRQYVDDVPDLDDHLQVVLDPQLFPGYAWIFPTGDTCANIGCGLVLAGANPKQGSQLLHAALRRLLDCEQLRGCTVQDRLLGSPLRSDFPAVPLYQDGLLVVGEAAGLVDPITGEGVRIAMRSGWLAARVAGYALENKDLTARSLKVYGDILNEWYGDYFRAARQFTAYLAKPEMLNILIRRSRGDPRVREGLYSVFLDKRPQEGLDLLQSVIK